MDLSLENQQSNTIASNSPKQELKNQQKLLNNILIQDIPRNHNENLNAIFAELCKFLNVTISSHDIQDIKWHSNDIVVELKSNRKKMEIFSAMHETPPWTKNLGKILPKNCKEKRIHIRHHLTEYYTNLFNIAKRYQDRDLLFDIEITANGLEVKRRKNERFTQILTEDDFDILIFGKKNRK